MGNNLKALRLAKRWTHDRAASEMGVSRGQFIKLERGERGLTERTITLAAKAFGVSRAEVIDEGESSAPVQGLAEDPPNYKATPEFLGERDLPVYAAAEGGSGHMIVSTDPIDIVQRPWYLRTVKEGYAVLIVGDSMSPAFEPGDMAIVNPRLPPMRGKDVILISGDENGEFTASIKRLVGWTDKEWKLMQFNPPRGQEREFSLPRKEWSKALRVVGKFYG